MTVIKSLKKLNRLPTLQQCILHKQKKQKKNPIILGSLSAGFLSPVRKGKLEVDPQSLQYILGEKNAVTPPNSHDRLMTTCKA